MTALYNSLTEISDGYTVFEKDQVLTESQLNSVSSYLDDQDRLSRVNLHGVGIVCGLKVALSGSTISLSRGIGITTDGDLIRIDTDRVYNRFRGYDNRYPKYAPLYSDATTMRPAFELVESGVTDPPATSLSQFNASTGLDLNDMTALLLMESYIKDSDLCSGTDCDNRGQDYVSTVRLLLVENNVPTSLMPVIQNSETAARRLSPLVARRVSVSASLTTQAQFAQAYLTQCDEMLDHLKLEWPKLWPDLSLLLKDAFSADPVPGWITQLGTIRAGINSNYAYFQYFHGFIKDLVDTWNELHALLFAETAWCVPDINGFAKHLMLGDLASAAEPVANRFSFYPSEAIHRGRESAEASFLLHKIDAMIKAYAPGALNDIQVTPSSLLKPLQQRAIPCYYRVNGSKPLFHYWNYRLESRGQSRYNYACHGGDFGVQGAAAEPLVSCIDGHDFFRVEGHLGHAVSDAVRDIEDSIRAHNLPFAVHAVLLGTNRSKIPNRKGAGYTDLHRFHYLLRQDLVNRLEETRVFSESFTLKINDAVNKNTVKDDVDGNDGVSVKTIAAEKNTSINQGTHAAKTKLNKKYADYRKDSSWLTDIGNTLSAAGQYRQNLGKVVETVHTTSFDHLIGNTNYNWLPWLDDIIRGRDERADDRKLFRNFIKDNPGLEHTGGVVRGGTFVLVYNDAGNVIADFMLSHYHVEMSEQEDQEPPLVKPSIPKGDLELGGIRIIPSLDNYLKDKLNHFELDLDTKWKPKFDLQTTYVDAFKGVTELFGNTFFQSAAQGAVVGDGKFSDKAPVDVFADDMLGVNVRRAREEIAIIDYLDEKMADPAITPDEKTAYQKERARSEKNLSANMESIVTHVDSKGMPVSGTSEASVAMKEVQNGMNKLKDNTIASESKGRLSGIMETTGDAALKAMLGGILGA